MAEHKEYWETGDEQGKIKISEDVIATIVCNAVSEVEGIVGLSTKPGADIADMIGKKKEEDDPEAAAVQTEIDTAAEENERLKAEIERLKAEPHFSSGEMSQLSSEKKEDKSEN